MMKKGWPIVKLGEVCEKIQDGAHISPQILHAEPGPGRFLYLTSKNIRTGYLKLNSVQYCEANFHNEIYPRCNVELGDVLLTKDGANTGNVAINTLNEPFSLLSSVCLLKPNSRKLLSRFLFYYIQSDEGFKQITGQMTGAAIKRIILKTVKTSCLPLAPLPEQRRIVGILDEAFKGIATANANAEKKLQNARALFDSHLNSVFTKRGNGWVEKSIAHCFKVRSGDFLPAKAMIETGDIDVYGGNGIAGKHSVKNLLGENIVIGRVGAKSGNVRHVIGDLWLTDNAFYISEYYCEFDLSFLERLLTLKQLRNTANQAAQPVISYTTIKDIPLEFPVSKAIQKKIANMLHTLEAETQRLESIYEQKLATLVELKKSLLHQAFTGNL